MGKVVMNPSGSQEFFDVFYYKYHKQVYFNIYKLVKNNSYAEDLLQEVFMIFWEHLPILNTKDDIAGWLFVVSYNKSLSFLRQKLKESSILLATESEPIDEASLMEYNSTDETVYKKQLEILNCAIEYLPSRKREVFRQCKIEGKKIDQVAEQMGISVASARNYLKQSTKLIRIYIRKYHATELASISSLMWILGH